MSRWKHSKKEVEDALRHAEANGWRVEPGGAHAWGRIYCPDDDGNSIYVREESEFMEKFELIKKDAEI